MHKFWWNSVFSFDNLGDQEALGETLEKLT